MKSCYHAFIMCQSMFCALPCPWKIWDEEARSKMLLFLPLVGLEIGLLWSLLGWLMQQLAFPPLMTAFLLCAYPYLVTGSIHLDGFMDVTDAIASWRPLEKRREILKDSHVGSFAVIALCLLLLAQFVCFASGSGNTEILMFLPIVSRCCSSLAILGLNPMSTSQYAGQRIRKGFMAILMLWLALAVAAGFWFCGKYGLALVGCLIGYGLALHRSYHSLKGMNGDIAGYALCTGELCGIAIYALI